MMASSAADGVQRRRAEGSSGDGEQHRMLMMASYAAVGLQRWTAHKSPGDGDRHWRWMAWEMENGELVVTQKRRCASLCPEVGTLQALNGRRGTAEDAALHSVAVIQRTPPYPTTEDAPSAGDKSPLGTHCTGKEKKHSDYSGELSSTPPHIKNREKYRLKCTIDLLLIIYHPPK